MWAILILFSSNHLAKMDRFTKLFPHQKPVIVGMLHLQALIGTPQNRYSQQQIMDMALAEAELYQKAGVDALMLENMHDIPYLKNEIGPEIISSMSVIAHQIKQATALPCGVQVLAGFNQEALAIAHAANLDFVRVEGFVFAHIADEGFIDGCAGKLLRYRRQINSENVLIFTDIKKKHSSHSLTADTDLLETAKAAAFFLSDGLIITGTATGSAANVNELKQLKKELRIPILVGSGITLYNVAQYLPYSDALIVGSWFKKQAYWANVVDYDRVATFMDKVRDLRVNM